MHKTKLLLINKGIEIMSDKGFHATSIRDIILASGIPKGSFYYYFESKEMYCLEIINHLSETINEITRSHVNDHRNFDSILIQNYLEDVFSANEKTGLLLLKLSVELSERVDFLGDAVRQLINSLVFSVAEIMSGNNEISHPKELAEILVFSRIGLKFKELQPDISPKFIQQTANELYKIFLTK